MLKPARTALLEGRLDTASTLYAQALAKARAAKDRKGEVDALRGMGLVLMQQNDPDKGLPMLNESIAIAREIGDVVGEGRGHMVLGNEFWNRRQPFPARERFERAIALLRGTDDLSSLGGCLVNLGLVETMLDTQKAESLLLEAIPVLQRAGNRPFEANAHNALGNLYRMTGRNALAIASFEKALPIYRELGNKPAEAGLQLNLGLTYRHLGEKAKALSLLEAARVAGNALKEPNIEGQATGAIADLIQDDDPARANRLYREAIRIAQISGDPSLAGTSHLNLGIWLLATGHWREARERFQAAMSAGEQANEPETQAEAIAMIGQTYIQTGQVELARESFERALAIQETRKDPLAIGYALMRLSNAQLDSGQLDQAEKSLKRSVALVRQVSPESGGNIVFNLALVYLDQGRFDAAIDAAEEGLRYFRAQEDFGGEGRALGFLGDVYDRMGRPDDAIRSIEASLAPLRRIEDRYVLAANLAILGRILAAQKRFPEALRRYDEAIALNEGFHADMGAFRESKARYLQTQLPVYYAALQARIETGDLRGAFALAQKTKARTLIDLMQAGRVDADAGLSPAERKKLADLRSQADRLNVRMMRESVENAVGAKKRFAALKRELAQVEQKVQAYTETLYASHPGLAQRRAAHSASHEEVAAALPPDTALLEYVVLSDRRLAIFVVTSDTRKAPIARVLDVEYAALARQAAALHAACADPRKPFRPAAAALHARLLAPVASALAGKKRLVICPDGALWDVPFAALVDPQGRFVAERFEVTTGFSATGAMASLAARTKRRTPSGTLLALANPDFGSSKRFGDLEGVPGQRPIDSPSRPIDTPSRPLDSPSRPLDSPSRPIDAPSRAIDSPSRAFDSVARGGRIVPLPGTQREADALRRLFPAATVLTGKAAQESNAKRRARGYRYLHFATHGVFNDAAPMLSSLVLAQPSGGSPEDGFLTAREIFDMDLSAEMAVLSACNTARGVQRTGDGVIGLTWALFAAGCPTQIVSQWAVDDASTAQLMERFYTHLVRDRMPKGAALRRASLSLMADPKRRHPYYWAPFVLMGDWR